MRKFIPALVVSNSLSMNSEQYTIDRRIDDGKFDNKKPLL